MNWCTDELPGLNSDWVLLRRLLLLLLSLLLKGSKSELKMIFSKTFPQLGKGETSPWLDNNCLWPFLWTEIMVALTQFQDRF